MQTIAASPLRIVRPFPGPVGGWLFFLAGLGLLAATLVIPAAGDLAGAEWQRDRAAAREAWQLERLDRHQAFIDALDRADPALVEALSATQLNLVRSDKTVLLPPETDWDTDLLPAIEPPLPHEPPRPESSSTLARLATSRTARLWLIAGAGLCLLLGLVEGFRGRG